jgi:arylsulfatase B
MGDPDWYRDRTPDLEVGYSTDLIARESIRFLERHRDEPHLLYVAFNAPHVPLQAKPEDLAAFGATAASDRSRAYSDSEEQNRRAYAAVVNALDGAIGAILAAIEQLGLREETLVLFSSDNGAWRAQGTGDNAPLRGGKNTLWEGGIRVPAALRWPGVVPVGRSDALVAYIDLLPTLQAITGAPLPDGHRLDGVDVLGVLRGERPPPDRLLRIGPGSAVSWRWKLKEGALFDLLADPGETTDVAARHPDVVASLQRRLRAGE